MRICEANTQTSRCPLHRARETSGAANPAKSSPIVSVTPRRLPAADVRPRRGRADVPLPAPSAKGDAGTLGSIWSPSAVSWTGACRPQPVRICEANTQTSRCPLHRARETSGAANPAKSSPIVSVTPRRLPAADVRPRRGRADVPLPAPSAKGDAGTLGSIWSPSAVSWTGACRPQPARICEANTRTPSCPLLCYKMLG